MRTDGQPSRDLGPRQAVGDPAELSPEDRVAELEGELERLRRGRGAAVLDGATAAGLRAIDRAITGAESELESLADASAEAVRRARESADATERARIADIESEIASLTAKRRELIERAEEGCRSMASAIALALNVGGDIAKAEAALGRRVSDGLIGESVARWFGERISAVLRTCSRSQARLGGLVLQRAWRRPETPWNDDAVPLGRRANGEDSEHERDSDD